MLSRQHETKGDILIEFKRGHFHKVATCRLNTIGFVFQHCHLSPRMTTAENSAIPLILKQRDWDESITEAKNHLEIVSLKDRGDILQVKLPGGEQHGVAIAHAIISSPEILILDEPTASLDGDTGRMDISSIARPTAVLGKALL
jgi:putative ABC transport system ATP-binding protein